MNKVEIYYFSGTGNSLHVARELQERLPETKLIPIVSLLDKDVIKTDAEIVGFVFPTYLTTVPIPVRQFLGKLDLKSSKYIFSVTTCIGVLCLANFHVEKALKKKGKKLDSSFILHMANNSPTGLRPVADKNWVDQITKEKIDKLECEVQNKIDFIKERIINKEKYQKKGLFSFLSYFMERIMSSMTKNMKTEIPYYPDEDCNGCGTCEKVCMSKKVRILDGKPIWTKDVRCYYCYACFNFCPSQSILVGKIYTDKNGRYYHPEIKSNDIAEQKGKLTDIR